MATEPGPGLRCHHEAPHLGDVAVCPPPSSHIPTCPIKPASPLLPPTFRIVREALLVSAARRGCLIKYQVELRETDVIHNYCMEGEAFPLTPFLLPASHPMINHELDRALTSQSKRNETMGEKMWATTNKQVFLKRGLNWGVGGGSVAVAENPWLEVVGARARDNIAMLGQQRQQLGGHPQNRNGGSLVGLVDIRMSADRVPSECQGGQSRVSQVSPCVLPNSILWHTGIGRPLLSVEKMALQGVTAPVALLEEMPTGVLDSLAGNAFCQPVWLVVLWTALYAIGSTLSSGSCGGDDSPNGSDSDIGALLSGV